VVYGNDNDGYYEARELLQANGDVIVGSLDISAQYPNGNYRIRKIYFCGDGSSVSYGIDVPSLPSVSNRLLYRANAALGAGGFVVNSYFYPPYLIPVVEPPGYLEAGGVQRYDVWTMSSDGIESVGGGAIVTLTMTELRLLIPGEPEQVLIDYTTAP
jgi:hypothetical protein